MQLILFTFVSKAPMREIVHDLAEHVQCFCAAATHVARGTTTHRELQHTTLLVKLSDEPGKQQAVEAKLWNTRFSPGLEVRVFPLSRLESVISGTWVGSTHQWDAASLQALAAR